MTIRSLTSICIRKSLVSTGRHIQCLKWITTVGRYTCPSSTASTSSARIDFGALDAKWQKRWAQQCRDSIGENQSQAEVAGKRQKYYVLPMFPYPSGMLHMGHLRVYTIADVVARFRRMIGYQVLHPMGWDAFGLPAENAAIENGVDPAQWTIDNIQHMKKQLISMNGDWDWDKEFRTCDSSFYKQTQHIFLLLYGHGLAYQAESEVNFDPLENTVLANEQVDSHGRSWRSGAVVEKRRLRQWFLRLTNYKDTLLNDLELLKDKWPERVISMQRNWLGKSTGSTLQYKILQSSSKDVIANVDIYTTRLDTLYGVQYIALSLQHPLVIQAAKKSHALSDFLSKAAALDANSKEGFLIENLKAQNPLASLSNSSGELEEILPVFAAPYVLDHYGTGAVMGVPAHDERDFAFWENNGDEKPTRQVVGPIRSHDAPSRKASVSGKPFCHKGILLEICGRFSGLESDKAHEQIMIALQEAGQRVLPASNWRIRDWLISRQRYWGTPIPIIHCNDCGPVPVPESNLPVRLPEIKLVGGSLENMHSWAETQCPRCNRSARRETDTMDTFMDSSWYYYRFPNVISEDGPFSKESANRYLPIDVYIGGVEHAILHLLYARFISKFLTKAGLWPKGLATGIRGEPFKQLICQGMVNGRTYSDPETGKILSSKEVITTSSGGIIIATGKEAKMTSEKMSKSKHNGVDPSGCISAYGADVTRAHVIFQAPVTEVLEWDSESIVGIQRWLHKVWSLVVHAGIASKKHDILAKGFPPSAMSNAESALWLETQRKIESVTSSYMSMTSLNTIISDLMKLSNTLSASSSHRTLQHSYAYFQSLHILIRMMAPITPAFAEECWDKLLGLSGDNSALERQATRGSSSSSIFNEPFPEADVNGALQHVDRKQTCAVQINGKLKFATEIAIPPDKLLKKDVSANENLRVWLVNQLLNTERGKKFLGQNGEKVSGARRTIIVKRGRTVNFVI